jgi:hypothetical protein
MTEQKTFGPSSIECTNADCGETATRVMAWPMLAGRAMFVAPYCDDHAAEIAKGSVGVPASGPALSAEAQKIGGLHA